MKVEFRLLGEFQVLVDGRPVEIGHPRQRGVLVALLVDANRLVSVDQLVDRVWGARRPSGPRPALYSYVSRLRTVFADIDGVAIEKRSGGYLLTVDPMVVDLHRFRHLVDQARANKDDELALDLFDQALGLWRGQPLNDQDTPWLVEVRESAISQRVAAELDRNDLKLGRGHHATLVSDLAVRAAEFPLDERLAGQLMLALYRCGRQADALNHYEAVRTLLAEELGTDPSPPLQQLHRQILTADAGLDLGTAPSRSSGATPPRQLPRDLDDFTGRGTELDRLLKSVPILDGVSTAVVISAIDGMAGIGKTTLAIHAAHQLAARYPDAHFYLDLHAHTVSQEPTDPAVALGTLLRSLGVPGERIPETLEERAALWRAELDDHRALVVLDNAASAGQVRPLLPGNPHCLVLITSRHRLTDLESAHTISVDALPVDDAVALFARVLGDDRALVAAESAREVVRLCGHLPLAIRIVAARLRSRPTWTIDRLIDRLQVGQQRLAELAVGDRSVAAAFELSYRHLTGEQQGLFRLLGLHPGTEFDTYAAAALADVEPDTAERLLEDLLDAHLVQQPTAGRYRFHDLLHDYAAKRSVDDATDADRDAAQTQLLDYYRHAASLANDALVPQEKHLRPTTASRAAMPRFADYDQALAWLDVERLNLLACAAYASRHGRPAYACDLSAILWRYFDLRGHNADALSMNAQVLAVIADAGDRHLEGVVRGNLGIANLGMGRSVEAGVELRQALALSRETGDRILEGRMLGNLGLVCWRLGDYEEALAYLQQTLAFAQQTGDISLEGRALHKIGVVLERLGRYDEALAHLESTLAVARDTGDRILEAEGYNALGMVAISANDPVESLAQHQRALALAMDNGNHHQSALAHNGIGLAYHNLGRSQDARRHWQQAIDLYTNISDAEAQRVRAQLEALDSPHLPV